MILIVDFGSQTTHLIGRRIREIGVDINIVNPDEAYPEVKNLKPKGIIFSGGPSSVYEKDAPTIDPRIFFLGIPILGICYGLQLTAHLLGGKVIAGKKEYGPAQLEIRNCPSVLSSGSKEKLEITKDFGKSFVVWMSHGDEVIKIPKDFDILGSSDHVPFAFVGDLERNIFGLQFHPEVEHTQFGNQLLKNFIAICKIPILKKDIDILEIKRNIQKIVGKKSYVIGAVSGGVDSTVAAALTAKAIGKRFIPIYVENGLMRKGTEENVSRIFKKIGIKPIVINVIGEMLKRLKKVTDSERKRKIIGNHYIEIFEKIRKKLLRKNLPVKFLLQGTIYSDVIESQGTKHSDKIKSHHNVGGLPKKMQLKLLEPLREFYKDQVRIIGRKLGLPEKFINKQPFPGPGFAIRIRGEVIQQRLEMEKKADEIVMIELEKAGILSSVFLSFPVMTNAFSTAVKGDGRHFGEVIALRVVESKDIMTSTWSRLPYDVLQKISSRIVNEVPGVSRVVYDITTKPPATMEWE